MKHSFKSGIIVFSFVLIFGCTKSDPFPKIKLPVFSGAINPDLAFDSPAKGAKAVSYDVKIDFPAKELTEFYDQEMKLMGFFQLPEQAIGTFKWEDFNSRSGDWEETDKIPARYTATWVDSGKTYRVWLYIAYKPRKGMDNWESTAFVSCNMSKFWDMEMVKKEYDNKNK